LVRGWGGNHASTANTSTPSGAIDATMGDVASSERDAALGTGVVHPSEQEFSGFVFKLQANLDPKHRDRMAFVRICSGVFRKGMKVQHSRLQRSLSLSSAQNLFAQDREEVTTAYPGDVIGIHNPGVFAIGDTIYTGSGTVAYPGIPSFSPERFAYIRNPNPSVYKKFQKVCRAVGSGCTGCQRLLLVRWCLLASSGAEFTEWMFCVSTQGLKELLDEGAVQLLRVRGDDGSGTPLLAAVGQLQFEVRGTYSISWFVGVCSLQCLF
jgi:peptide chain release factor 3